MKGENMNSANNLTMTQSTKHDQVNNHGWNLMEISFIQKKNSLPASTMLMDLSDWGDYSLDLSDRVARHWALLNSFRW